MSVRTQQADARRRAREARSKQDRARVARAKRLEDLAVTVLTSIDAAAAHEQRAGEALRAMVEQEGLTLREAVSWCGDEMSVHTAVRLKRLIAAESSEPASATTGRSGGREEGRGEGVADGQDGSTRATPTDGGSSVASPATSVSPAASE